MLVLPVSITTTTESRKARLLIVLCQKMQISKPETLTSEKALLVNKYSSAESHLSFSFRITTIAMRINLSYLNFLSFFKNLVVIELTL